MSLPQHPTTTKLFLQGGVVFQLAWKFERYPFKLFRILAGNSTTERNNIAAELATDKACLRDPFSQHICDTYGLENLSSDDCIATLTVVAYLLRLCISRIECRHAAIRRLLRAKGSTWSADFPSISSDFALMRQHLLQQDLKCDGIKRKIDGDETNQDPVIKKRRGGAMRAFMSEFMENKRTSGDKDAWKEAHAAYKQIKSEGGDEFR
jgi:hypothetical protein